MNRRLISISLLIIFSAGCSNAAPSSTPSSSRYRVLATTSIFADLAHLALGDVVHIDSIVPAGIDVHTYEPSPSDAAKITGAQLVIMNGLGLDDWVGPLIDAAHGSTSDLLRLGEGLDDSDGWIYLTSASTAKTPDPHVWLDPNGAALYLKRIAARVTADRPDLDEEIRSTLAQGLTSLHQLDADVGALFSAIPPAKRQIITFHDAFRYYARAYDITIVGVAIASPGQDPSAREIAALIDTIRASTVMTVFSEVQFPSKVLNSIAAETGATVLTNLYSDALAAAPGDTYLNAMRANASAIAGSMQR